MPRSVLSPLGCCKADILSATTSTQDLSSVRLSDSSLIALCRPSLVSEDV